MKKLRLIIVTILIVVLLLVSINYYANHRLDVIPSTVSARTIWYDARLALRAKEIAPATNSAIELTSVDQVTAFSPSSHGSVLTKAVERGWKIKILYYSKDSFDIFVQKGDESECFDANGGACSPPKAQG